MESPVPRLFTMIAIIPLLLIIPVVLAQDEAGMAGAFKRRFLQYSRHCAQIHDTSTVDIMALLGAEELAANKGKCYLFCIMNKYQIMNQKGPYNKTNFRAFVDSMPQSRFRKSLEAHSNKCFQEDAPDPCQKAYKFIKCFYNAAAKVNLEVLEANDSDLGMQFFLRACLSRSKCTI